TDRLLTIEAWCETGCGADAKLTADVDIVVGARGATATADGRVANAVGALVSGRVVAPISRTGAGVTASLEHAAVTRSTAAPMKIESQASWFLPSQPRFQPKYLCAANLRRARLSAHRGARYEAAGCLFPREGGS